MHDLQLLVRTIFVGGTLLAATAAQGQPPNVQSTPSTGGIDVSKTTSPLQNFMFGGSLMDDSRARAIADHEGFNFVSWEGCSGVSDCIMLEVKGRQQGWVYRYVLVGEKCSPLSTAHPSGPAGDAGKTADHCFGGYTVLIRARQHNSYSSYQNYYTARFEEDWQAIAGGKWTPFSTTISSAWEQPVPNSGADERGAAFSWLDPSGKVLQKDASVENIISSSGSQTGVTAKDLCQAQQDFKKARLTEKAEKKAELCTLVPIPQTISVTGGGEGTLEPEGVGGKISVNVGATKTLDFCALNRNIDLASALAAADQEYLDCLQHPGRYFPSSFPPEPAALDLTNVKGFEPVAPTKITIAGACPIDKKVQVEQDMGGGWVCTTTTTYTGCHPVKESDQQESCECTQKGSSAEVCTGG
jgi:hypothetical protein